MNHETRRCEAQPQENTFLPLFELSARQTEALKEKIAQSNGLLRIFIHPFFDENAVEKGHPPLFAMEKKPS